MSNAQDKTDAISLLTADHRKVRRLFQEFEELEEEEGQDDLKSELVEQICFELSMHALVEEEIFYPAVRGAIDDDELMDEAQAEHAQVKDLIGELEEMTPGDGRFDATVMELSEQVEHHVSEEESAMFAKAAKAGLDLEALGLQIKQRKEAMEEDFSNVPGPEAARGGADAGHKGANP
ncbi:MAG: hemerythrin domain-containing protein [Burkholderiaceae bacterium]|nr:hemerythrin domain-containing protein [Burkholderiaceae bacterium]